MTTMPLGTATPAIDPEHHLLYVLLDSNLPTGGFVSSSGLESYAKHGFLGISSDPQPYLSGKYQDRSLSTASGTGANAGSRNGASAGVGSRLGTSAGSGSQDVIAGVKGFAEAEVGHYGSTTGCFVRDAWGLVENVLSMHGGGGRWVEEERDECLAGIQDLDDYHDATLLSHVAKRASKAQGVAMLTLFSRGLSRPPSSMKEEGLNHGGGAEREERAREIVDGYKKLVRRGDAQGHLAVCWGIITSALGIKLERALHLHLFLHARSLLSSAVRLNLIGPYLSSQLLLHSFRDIIEHEVERLIMEPAPPKDQGEREGEGDFWAWTKEAESGPATTWPLGEVLMGRHDMQHSRIFNS